MPPRPDTHAPSTRFLAGAFVAVAVSFLLVATYTHVMTHQIDVASDSIALDTEPSVEHLSAVRTDVRKVERLVEAAVGLSGRSAPPRAEIDAALAELERNAGAYLALPFGPAERSHWDEMHASLLGLTATAHQVLALADAGSPEAAREAYRSSFRPAVERAADAAIRDVEFNAGAGRDAALLIKRIRRHAMVVSFGLDALCLVVAVLAALIVRRGVRRHAEILQEHARLVEDRARELEFFAGRVAHDVASPVATAQLAIELALRREATGDRLPARDHVARAQRNLRRAQAIIDGLLRFARAGARPNPGATADVAHVAEDVVRSASEVEGSGAELRWEGVPCEVACDEGVLTSILSNLVQNAVKYLGDGPERRVAVRAVPSAGVVRIEVEDSGTGMPPDLLGRAFEPYVRGAGHATPGLGLGLATVKRLVEGHGGRVGVESEPGRGCRFWFELAGAAPHPKSQALLEPFPPASGSV